MKKTTKKTAITMSAFGKTEDVTIVGTTGTANKGLRAKIVAFVTKSAEGVEGVNHAKRVDVYRTICADISATFKAHAIAEMVDLATNDAKAFWLAMADGKTYGVAKVDAHGDIKVEDVKTMRVKHVQNGKEIEEKLNACVTLSDVKNALDRENKERKKANAKQMPFVGEWDEKSMKVLAVYANILCGTYSTDDAELLTALGLSHLHRNGKALENWKMAFIQYFYTVLNGFTGYNYKPIKQAFFYHADTFEWIDLVYADKRVSRTDAMTNSHTASGRMTLAIMDVLTMKYMHTHAKCNGKTDTENVRTNHVHIRYAGADTAKATETKTTAKPKSAEAQNKAKERAKAGQAKRKEAQTASAKPEAKTAENK